MIRAALLALAAAGALLQADMPRSNRAAMSAAEKQLDQHIRAAEPFHLLGHARGVYLEGYGAVFSVQVDLMMTPGLSPVTPTISREEVARIREKKLARLPLLRDEMRRMLVNAAAVLDPIPPEEQVVLAVSLFFRHFEDSSGMPAQIVMQAGRETLLELRKKKDGLNGAAIQVREF
ncbi:MAG: hypothetical protein FJW37_00355 [Acidobacteria bacterium]|nr:hypothetical protein [Acidobacteriota bacterium]